MDSGDASCSFLMDPRERRWSRTMIDLLGLDAAKLPPIREPLEILGAVTAAAASETGLREGTPVLVGGADYPVALLGSGACRPGLASDVTGTSCILTLIADAPLLDPESLQRRDRRRTLGAVRPSRDRRRRDALGAARLPRKGAELRRHHGARRRRAGRFGRPLLHALSHGRAARRASQRAGAILWPWRGPRARASPSRRARRRRLRRRAPPAHHGESRRPKGSNASSPRAAARRRTCG